MTLYLCAGVYTAQYFVWFCAFAPLVVPGSSLGPRLSVALLGLWAAGLAHWLAWASAREFKVGVFLLRQYSRL